MAEARRTLSVGIDIGSTTVKVVALADDGATVFSRYVRHGARQARTVASVLTELGQAFPGAVFRAALTGSGASTLADALDLPYVQEVVANSIAVRALFPEARTAIELGGQDAKIIFFEPDPRTGELTVSNMRMNGSCAGGTGAFLDEIASLLKVAPEGYDALAAAGTTVYDISGRCGVYAKTDIQPLINQGVSREDIALSSLHAVAKQTIGGLAQGLDVVAPVVFEGGPLTFDPTLVRVFSERLGLAPDEAIVPEHAETIMARGTALAVGQLFADRPADLDVPRAVAVLQELDGRPAEREAPAPPFFSSAEERWDFERRHAAPEDPTPAAPVDGRLQVYLGIDSGSTTTKFALVDATGALVDSFYASNEGAPLDVAARALRELARRHRAAGHELEVLGVGTTGYGELMFAKAFGADHHVVETVAHARAVRDLVPDATFVLDIGGQDMKAIWLDNGVITNVVVNEACSSGCGSFLETFARTLGIPVEGIAEAAFRSSAPAHLGSRCTVFMTSSIVTEQRNGKSPDDIMAGLCRSIIENVFTKVVRVPSMDALGEKIVVQGGTFLNDAVLRAFEQRVGRPVTRSPHAGLMGAIGVAQLVRERAEEGMRATGCRPRTAFVGFDALREFSYETETGLTCPFCQNHCSRTRIVFSSGESFVTGNRCPRGEVVGDPRDEGVRAQERKVRERTARVPNLFAERERLLFREYPVEPVRDLGDKAPVIGLPRVLALWEWAPFWTTLVRAVGYRAHLSRRSTRAIYERGLPAVTSDTVCFPAKLVHGHLRDLADAGVDRILMPSITTVPSDNAAPTSQSMCAVVKGYPLVVRNSDNPERRWGIPFDAPLFHWYSKKDREGQLMDWLRAWAGVTRVQARSAIRQAAAAQRAFREELERRGREVLEQVGRDGGYAVALASRPYQNDALVNHDLPGLFVRMGVPVLTADAVPGVHDVDLSASRIDVVNNFHERMLGSAVIAARDPRLEYVQLVSFGCGHDAYLSDEIVRLMHEVGEKAPLILKLDESDATGPLGIRVRSFVETVRERRAAARAAGGAADPRPLSDPYPVKFERGDEKVYEVIVPNTSHAFSRLMAAVVSRQGLRAVPLEIGREEAIRLGKRYVHNDICFPAQIVIGEILAELERGGHDPDRTAVMMAKYVGDCRLTHYGALLRKALDDAGYPQVPIITNDGADSHDLHPGFRLGVPASTNFVLGIAMVDVYEALLRKVRPYETEPGAADAAFERAMDGLIEGISAHGARGALDAFPRGLEALSAVPHDRSHLRPRVLIVGEYLLNFHPGANHEIERYLEANGLEVVEARMADVIRKSYSYKHAQAREYHVDIPGRERAWNALADRIFSTALALVDRVARDFPLYERPASMAQLAEKSDPIIPHTFDAGEGILIPAEILEQAARGVRNFVILQPFGCLPNHVVGRGIIKRVKELYPDAQVLPLDYDPDVSQANIENRLQMLVMDARPDVPADEAAGAAPKGER
ncbi:acyl-CoA dehydratase activase [Olsenella sp. An290]|uniref:acyl-CoA dehydratase activase n=1 Tax=Olsenella sp. An290 TaxID=1965625 RepID=UPI000B36A1B2|nr:acyl-CoA dehydratase activase [Olsenella sp. An290]OUO35940.1 activase [Olsenella sp. An290]